MTSSQTLVLNALNTKWFEEASQAMLTKKLKVVCFPFAHTVPQLPAHECTLDLGHVAGHGPGGQHTLVHIKGQFGFAGGTTVETSQKGPFITRPKPLAHPLQA